MNNKPIRWGETLVNRNVRRLPAGRWCRIVEVDSVARMLKIRDSNFWTGWITERTFNEKWTLA